MRSALAEIILKNNGFKHTKSAGTIKEINRNIDPCLKKYLKENNLKVPNHRSENIDKLNLEKFDFIICFDIKNYIYVGSNYSKYKNKLFLFSNFFENRKFNIVVDPYKKEYAIAKKIFDRINLVIKSNVY